MDKTKKIFNNISLNYDKLNDIITLGSHKRWRKKVNQKIGYLKKKSVLDLASGTGDWAISLAKQSDEQTKILALDYSEKMIEVAKTKVSNLSNELAEKINFAIGNALDTKLLSNSVDLITIGFGVRNFHDLNQTFVECNRLLNEKGQLIILETAIPKNPIIKSCWKLYTGILMPFLGYLFAHKYQEYRYLYESSLSFEQEDEIKAVAKKHDLTLTEVDSFMFGSVKAYYFEK